jgi:hypothetical protein
VIRVARPIRVLDRMLREALLRETLRLSASEAFRCDGHTQRRTAAAGAKGALAGARRLHPLLRRAR